MLIANPLYDIVFKHLMEDLEIAKGFVSALLGVEVLELHFASEEQRVEPPQPSGKRGIFVIYRRDFVARIKLADGLEKRVVIEVQKSRLGSDLWRFRNYLGKQYREKEDVTDAKGRTRAKCLEVIAVFILGFELSDDLPAVLKVDRKCEDRLTGKEVQASHDYIELLTHTAYFVQTRKLARRAEGELEHSLSVFSQEGLPRYKAVLVDYPAEDETNPLVKRMLRRLAALGADEKVRKQMETEDQVFEEIAIAVELLRDQLEDSREETEEERRQKEEALRTQEEERRQKEEERRQKEEERRQKEEERRQKEEERRQKEEERRQKEEALRRQEEALRQADEQRLLKERALATALEALLGAGIPEPQARETLGLS